MRLIASLSLLLAIGLSACDRAAEGPSADNATQNQTELGSSTDGQAATGDAGPVLDRLGAIRVGATLGELEAAGLRVAGRDDVLPGSTCAYARFRGWDDVAVMLDGERVVRIDVSGIQHEGPRGLRVGQSESEAIERLGNPEVQPHPYTGPQGHYLISHLEGAAMGLIAETDGKTVERWRMGNWEQVQWIEGCA
jgi:hypothetical protein